MASKALLDRLAALEALVSTTGLDLTPDEQQALTAVLHYPSTPSLEVFTTDHPSIPRNVAAETLKHWAMIEDLMNNTK
ncbi:hypothetical protein [Cobetia crustatorum]|uniref:Uncharacterized protein n=1 Tax=Cobetia crustatorum TaxID=553385 RepID=A0A558HXK4_9GAMM|nr:hypothetical protein [Cobetia crustatorum]TVU73847.1 hypothetical protein FQP86_01915 [Cobetia crustatorum]